MRGPPGTSARSPVRGAAAEPARARYLAAMDAMIFAAGLGTRLRPLTNELPKALVEVAGVPVLEHVARRLIDAGADRLIINAHHFADRIEEFVRARDGFGVDVRISHEPDAPLDTGGGLLRAACHFRRDAPFFLHNCDVLSDIDLRALHDAHLAGSGGDDHGGRLDGACVMATLAVLPPLPERYLLFDGEGLCGYAPRGGGDEVLVRELSGELARRHFTGVHVASPALLDALSGDGAFSIINAYVGLVRSGRRIARYEQPGAWWTDIGSHEELAAVRNRLQGR
jgi:NDP-sugar pyrophosphorylase family protein